MRRTILTLAIIAALLLTVPASGAGPSLANLAKQVHYAIVHAKRAERMASKALNQPPTVVQGTQGPSGPQGAAGVAGSNGTDGRDGTDGTNGENGRTGATGPKGDQGIQGEAGPPGVAVAYAHATFDGLDTAHSSSNIMMRRGNNGSLVYCFDVADADVRSASVTLDGTQFGVNFVRAFVDVPAREACGAADFSVLLADPNTGPVSGGFFALVE